MRERRIIFGNPEEIANKPGAKENAVLVGDERMPQSGIYIPLITGDSIYGIMTMQHYEANVFQEKHISLVATIASQAATVLENAHLYRTVQNHARTLEERVKERTLELEQEKDRVESILSGASEVIVLIDHQGNLIQANPAFEKQFLVAPGALSGKSLLNVFVGSSQAAFLNAIQTAIETRQVRIFEAVCIRQDESLFEAEVAITPLANPGEGATNAVCVIHDVTRHKQIEKSLRNALQQEKEINELKARFSSMISHEFRTPLLVILSSADMLKTYGGRLSEERKQAKLADIESQVQRLVGMLDNMLALSRADAVDVVESKKRLDLVDICREIVNEIQQTTPSHTLEFTVSGERRPLELDPQMMRDIIRNLLSNAVKYSAGDHPIQIQCRFEHDEVVLRVSDRGIGIPDEDKQRLFEAFHRAGNVSTIAGTGLGLAIVKRAVEAHQGTITVDSKAGVGSTFTVAIPTAPAG